MGRQGTSRRTDWLAALLIAATALLPSMAAADWREFVPRPYENGAFADLYFSFEREHFDTSGRVTEWKDYFFREKLTLFSRGYSYHPRFLQYRFSISGAASQENYDATAYSQPWHADPGFEYDTFMILLPEHTYNLEVYARRYEPLLMEQASDEHGNIDQREGFDFRYRDKPWFFHAGFLDDKVDTGNNTARIDRINTDGQYFQRFSGGNDLSFNGAVIPTWFQNSEGLDGSSLEWNVGNLVNIDQPPSWGVPARVTSNVSGNQYEQQSYGPGDLNTDNLIWYEWVTLELPWNLRENLYYRYQDNDNRSGDQHQTYKANDLRLETIHRLYESLESRYVYTDDTRDSGDGDSNLHGHTLLFSYSKLIPYGRLLAGLNVGRSDTDNNGTIDVIDEPFSSTVPMLQPYVLGQQNVDPASVVLYMISPLAPFNRVYIDPSHYTLIPLQNTYGILVTSVPAEFSGTGPFDFLVSYSYSGDFSLRTDTLGANTSVDLFDNFLTPYFSYVVVRSKVLSGEFPGIPVDSSTYTGGLMVRFWGVQLRGEWQKFEWDVSPYEQWRAEAQYIRALSDTTNLYSAASYNNRHYSRGTGVYYDEAFTEETETVSASIQQQLFTRSLNASVGGSYSHVDGIVNSDAYSVHTSLIWHVGKVDVILGSNVYGSNASGQATTNTERDHQFVYLNLRRRLF